MAPTDEITSRQALEILGLKRASSISRLVAAGKLTPSRQLPPERNGPFLFWRHDVQRLADQRKEAAA